MFLTQMKSICYLKDTIELNSELDKLATSMESLTLLLQGIFLTTCLFCASTLGCAADLVKSFELLLEPSTGGRLRLALRVRVLLSFRTRGH